METKIEADTNDTAECSHDDKLSTGTGVLGLTDILKINVKQKFGAAPNVRPPGIVILIVHWFLMIVLVLENYKFLSVIVPEKHFNFEL